MKSAFSDNIDEKRAQLRRFESALEDELRQMGTPIFSQIANRAIGQYMREARGEGPRSPSDDGPLRIVTSRLARSLQGSFGQFGRGAGSGSREAIRKIDASGGRLELTQGSRVPYAAIHEYGGSVRVTPAMRGFFWHRYYETGGEGNPSAGRWKGMALSTKSVFNIPARPYLEPALEDEAKWIRNFAADQIAARMRREFGSSGITDDPQGGAPR